MATIDIDAEIKKALSEAFGAKADAVGKMRDDAAKVEFEAYKVKISGLSKLMKERNELVKDVPDFWFQALLSSNVQVYIDLQDHEALKAITGVEVTWESDPRAFTITFTFAENKHFSDKTLSKSFKPAPDGPKMDTYSLNADLTTTPSPISWKSDKVNLVKLKPRPKAVEAEEFDEYEDSGSFFCWFSDEDDKIALGEHLVD